ncbi:hypothetical protein CWC14_12145 [Pseudoalteromonas sp. S3260]|uniref:hypothetical protein n=1 Tax=Pseudoalteromonas sp. S3260 TaxID=579534 RepID=UPI00110A127D|nr:hypothetical protein [Pseudoalteromonas sp. S3260]TMO95798.1 hypothetical protein CWC14_12145 [Pseudoalteromonas sp. S3260]
MHSRYASVFGIEKLELNQHFRPAQAELSATSSLILSDTLKDDIERAFAPVTINSIVKSSTIEFSEQQLGLPDSNLTCAQKRALWALMSEHLDAL